MRFQSENAILKSLWLGVHGASVTSLNFIYAAFMYRRLTSQMQRSPGFYGAIFSKAFGLTGKLKNAKLMRCTYVTPFLL